VGRRFAPLALPAATRYQVEAEPDAPLPRRKRCLHPASLPPRHHPPHNTCRSRGSSTMVIYTAPSSERPGPLCCAVCSRSVRLPVLDRRLVAPFCYDTPPVDLSCLLPLRRLQPGTWRTLAAHLPPVLLCLRRLFYEVAHTTSELGLRLHTLSFEV
jgi:hypothetical protein